MIKRIKEIYSFRELIINFVVRDLKVRYHGSFLGMFWSFLNPLLNMLILAVVLSFVFKAGIKNFPVFLLIGIIVWQFHAASLIQSARSIIDNGGMIKKIYLPKEIFPLSIILANLYQLSFSVVILIILIVFFQVEITLLVLLLPYFLFLQLMFTLGISLILSSIGVFFRDVPLLLESLIPLWYFLSPIMYPSSFVPEKFYTLYMLNPMASFVESYRDILLYGKIPSVEAFVVTFTFSIVSLVLGFKIFTRLQGGFADEV